MENSNQLHQQFKTYGQNAKVWTNKCLFLLPEIVKQQIWKHYGFENIYDYALKLAGISKYKVEMALWVFKNISQFPLLKKVAEEKGINAIRSVITIVNKDNEKFWADKAKSMCKQALEAYTSSYRKKHMLSTEFTKEPSFKNQFSNNFNSYFDPSKLNLTGCPGTRIESDNKINEEQVQPQGTPQVIKITEAEYYQSKLCEVSPSFSEKVIITIELDRQTLEDLNKIKGKNDWSTAIKQLIKEREEKFQATKPETKVTSTRNIPTSIKNYVLKRTNNNCAFPGCKKPYEILHHTKRFALDQEHNPDTIYPLCKAHEQLFHYGLIENEHLAPQYWKILKEPDKQHPKYEIDNIVNKYRIQR